jgi:hypothetical protein
MLCMAATLHAGFSAAQNDIMNLQHQVSGDAKLADGGWAPCAADDHDCDGHVELAGTDDDGVGLNHHHHPSEGPSAAIVASGTLLPAALAEALILRPSAVSPLAGRSPGTLDQPPRV